MKIESLFVYPIKSCRGIVLGQSEVKTTGLEYDRTFTLVDEDGVFISQRTELRMCLIKVDIGDNPETNAGSAFWVEAEGMPKLFIPIGLGSSRYVNDDQKECSIRIHKDTCKGVDVGDKWAEWFSVFLKRKCRLIRQSSQHTRFRR